MSGSFYLDITERNLLADDPAVDCVDHWAVCIRGDDKGIADVTIAFVAHGIGIGDGGSGLDISREEGHRCSCAFESNGHIDVDCRAGGDDDAGHDYGPFSGGCLDDCVSHSADGSGQAEPESLVDDVLETSGCDTLDKRHCSTLSLHASLLYGRSISLPFE